MGKKDKKKKESESEEEEDKNKKVKKGDKKKKKEKKGKKDKGKKKKGKKKESSSSSSGSSSASGGDEKKGKKRKAEEGEGELIAAILPPKHSICLAPPEEGILRFEYTAEETGPLGVRFGSGFPPLILSVSPGSLSAQKGVPATYSVHAINGLALIPQNTQVVMPCLKARPVTLDVRPVDWKPPDMVREINKKKAAEQAQLAVRGEVEMARREQVAQEKKSQDEKDAAERAERQAKEAEERGEAIKLARAARDVQRGKTEDFRKLIEADPADMRAKANALMDAEYGSKIKDGHAVPLRLFTRRKEVAWTWDSAVMELIGGGINSDDDSWDA